MTSREQTGFLPRRENEASAEPAPSPLSTRAYRLLFGAIGWPWLLYSLWGGTKASKARLLTRVDLGPDALPHLGSWKADTGFLHRIVDAVEELRPRTVVELGAGASSLICGKALQMHGGGKLFSYDQHGDFVEATRHWLADHGIAADIRHAPLSARIEGWPGEWYALSGLPDQIDLLIIDGPPWAVHPFVRGAAESLFDRLSPGGIVLLDDAARPGERIVARRWRRRNRHIAFTRLGGSTKGTLIGRKATSAKIVAFPEKQKGRRSDALRRAAAILLLLGTGWIARDVMTESPAQATTFTDAALASDTASLARLRMKSQVETPRLDRAELVRTTGITLPALPASWQVIDVQLYPAGKSMAVALLLRTDRGESISLFAAKAETPAGKNPLLTRSDSRAVAYWEAGDLAYAVTAGLPPERVLGLAAQIAGS